MGSDPNEKRKGKAAPSRKGEPNPFVVFRPTEAQKAAIKEQGLSLDECWLVLYPLLEAGHKITVGYKAENEAVFIHLREGGADWTNAVTVSCWHTDLVRVHQMLAFAVKHVYPEFPTVQLGFGATAPDW